MRRYSQLQLSHYCRFGMMNGEKRQNFMVTLSVKFLLFSTRGVLFRLIVPMQGLVQTSCWSIRVG